MVTSPVPHSHIGVHHLNTHHTYLKHLSCTVCFLITGSTAPQHKIGSMVLKTVCCLQNGSQMHLGCSWSRSDPPLHGKSYRVLPNRRLLLTPGRARHGPCLWLHPSPAWNAPLSQPCPSILFSLASSVHRFVLRLIYP